MQRYKGSTAIEVKRRQGAELEDPPAGGDEPNRRMAVSSAKANPIKRETKFRVSGRSYELGVVSH